MGPPTGVASITNAILNERGHTGCSKGSVTVDSYGYTDEDILNKYIEDELAIFKIHLNHTTKIEGDKAIITYRDYTPDELKIEMEERKARRRDPFANTKKVRVKKEPKNETKKKEDSKEQTKEQPKDAKKEQPKDAKKEQPKDAKKEQPKEPPKEAKKKK